MTKIIYFTLALILLSCGDKTNNSDAKSSQKMTSKKQGELSNPQVKEYQFLKHMYEDSYYPNHLVDRIKNILVNLCFEIESIKPNNLSDLYNLTHAATNRINDLQDDFFESDSEIETVAREAIADDFDFIAKSYGFEADIEELIATRDW